MPLQTTLYALDPFLQFLEQQQNLADGLLGRQIYPFPGLNHASSALSAACPDSVPERAVSIVT